MLPNSPNEIQAALEFEDSGQQAKYLALLKQFAAIMAQRDSFKALYEAEQKTAALERETAALEREKTKLVVKCLERRPDMEAVLKGLEALKVEQ